MPTLHNCSHGQCFKPFQSGDRLTPLFLCLQALADIRMRSEEQQAEFAVHGLTSKTMRTSAAAASQEVNVAILHSDFGTKLLVGAIDKS